MIYAYDKGYLDKVRAAREPTERNRSIMEQFKLIKAYQNNAVLRQSFNQLAEKTFGLNFEDWYQNGFWSENYIPYSMAVHDEVVANVSVNIIDMIWDGEKKYFIQLGTVMTREDYRKQGLIRQLMEEIEKDFGAMAEGMFLFANDNVLSFYPKFGFEKETEYQYSKEVHPKGAGTAQQVPMKEKKDLNRLIQAMEESEIHSRFEMTDNIQLIMFYVTKFMHENVYYIEESDSYVIAEIEEGNLLIHDVYSRAMIDLDSVIEAFGREIHSVTLGFTPINEKGYTIREIQEEDTTLFIKGKSLTGLGKDKIMFPTLSHA